MYPTNFRYTKDHEWIEITGNEGKIGITHHAQEMLGDIVFVELPKVGTHFNSHDTLCTIESVKAVSEVFSPVSGEVIEINSSVAEDPELVNKDPHGEAWIARIKLSNVSELDALMDAEAYEKYVKEVEEK